MRLVLPDLEQATLRPGNGALDEQQVPLRVDGMNDEADLGPALSAHTAGHLDALEDARRRCRRTDRARLADVVRAVRHGATREVVALDRALEALADADAGDLHRVARLEHLDRHGFTDDGLRRPTELDEVPMRLDTVFLQMAELALRELPFRHRAER